MIKKLTFLSRCPTVGSIGRCSSSTPSPSPSSPSLLSATPVLSSLLLSATVWSRDVPAEAPPENLSPPLKREGEEKDYSQCGGNRGSDSAQYVQTVTTSV